MGGALQQVTQIGSTSILNWFTSMFQRLLCGAEMARHSQEWMRIIVPSAASYPELQMFSHGQFFSSWQSIAASARRWRAADVLCISDEASRPVARTAPRGLRKSFRGVSPPPSDGWVRGARGWEAHAAAQNWVRKAVEAEEATEAAAHGAAYIYFYVPTQSLWMELPNGTFACIETYHSAVAAFIVASGGALLRTVFFTWCSQARVVRQWRSRINVMSSSFGEQESEEILGSGSTAEAAEAAWSVKTAFLSSRRRLRER